MIKKLMVLILFAFYTSAHALEIDTVVPLTGSSTPAGTFYFDINEKYDLVLGFSSIVPGSASKEVDVDLKIGVNAPMPIIDRCDMFLVFDNHGGQVIEGGHDSEFYLHSFQVSKRWLYAFSNSIDLGVTIKLIEVLLEDVNEVHILPSVTPIMGLTIRF